MDRRQLMDLIFPFVFVSGKTENFQNAFDSDSLSLTNLPLAFYSGLYAYGGWCVLAAVSNIYKYK